MGGIVDGLQIGAGQREFIAERFVIGGKRADENGVIGDIFGNEDAKLRRGAVLMIVRILEDGGTDPPGVGQIIECGAAMEIDHRDKTGNEHENPEHQVAQDEARQGKAISPERAGRAPNLAPGNVPRTMARSAGMPRRRPARPHRKLAMAKPEVPERTTVAATSIGTRWLGAGDAATAEGGRSCRKSCAEVAPRADDIFPKGSQPAWPCFQKSVSGETNPVFHIS